MASITNEMLENGWFVDNESTVKDHEALDNWPNVWAVVGSWGDKVTLRNPFNPQIVISRISEWKTTELKEEDFAKIAETFNSRESLKVMDKRVRITEKVLITKYGIEYPKATKETGDPSYSVNEHADWTPYPYMFNVRRHLPSSFKLSFNLSLSYVTVNTWDDGNDPEMLKRSPDVLNVICMPSGTGKSFYTSLYPCFRDIDSVIDAPMYKKKMKGLRAEALKSGDWTKVNNTNMHHMQDYLTAYPKESEKIWLIHGVGVFGKRPLFKMNVLWKAKLTKGDMKPVLAQRQKMDKQWFECTKLNWSTSFDNETINCKFSRKHVAETMCRFADWYKEDLSSILKYASIAKHQVNGNIFTFDNCVYKAAWERKCDTSNVGSVFRYRIVIPDGCVPGCDLGTKDLFNSAGKRGSKSLRGIRSGKSRMKKTIARGKTKSELQSRRNTGNRNMPGVGKARIAKTIQGFTEAEVEQLENTSIVKDIRIREARKNESRLRRLNGLRTPKTEEEKALEDALYGKTSGSTKRARKIKVADSNDIEAARFEF